MLRVFIVLCLLVAPSFTQQGADLKQQGSQPNNIMDKVYRDQSHCLTSPEIRSDNDVPISCFCRDDIAIARYVYVTYLLSGKDRNLNGAFLALQQRATGSCGEAIDVIMDKTQAKEWKWDGPEVVRTYPSDEVIERISPKMENGKPVGRWVPFTVQLIFRDAQGKITRTENYSSREFDPVWPK